MLAAAPPPDPDREQLISALIHMGAIEPDQIIEMAHLTYDDLLCLIAEYHEAICETQVWVGRRLVEPQKRCVRAQLAHVPRRRRHCQHPPVGRCKNNR